MTQPTDVLEFWLDEVGPKGWYAGGEALDTLCRDRFEDAWNKLMEGTFSLWLTYPSGTLAYCILSDQLPRNMFRGSGTAFASDRFALAAAKSAISRGWDLRIDDPARQFFYLPLMHSENLCDQDRAVRLIHARMADPEGQHLLHAKAHREVIRRYGRFPTRNLALARTSSGPEREYEAGGGYGTILQSLSA